MASQETNTCAICGTQYEACLSCKSRDALKPWRLITDTQDCYKLFLILRQYYNGYIDKTIAKKQLTTVRYDLKKLRESVQKQIGEIMDVEAKPKKTKVKTEK